jgi:hypothetical protein
MEICWHENPLKTTFRLSAEDKELLQLRAIAAELEENVGSAAFHLSGADEDKSYFDPEKAKRYLGYACEEDVGEKEYGLYLSELESGVHIGDCTCFPATCMKCYAEYIYGVTTLQGLGKHSAHKIYAAFSADGSTTIHDVIEQLENYTPTRSGAWLNMPKEAFSQHVPRWKSEAQSAAKWLTSYRDQHFPLQSGKPSDEQVIS